MKSVSRRTTTEHCRCLSGTREGWTYRRGLWVHPTCGKPSKGWLAAQRAKP